MLPTTDKTGHGGAESPPGRASEDAPPWLHGECSAGLFHAVYTSRKDVLAVACAGPGGRL